MEMKKQMILLAVALGLAAPSFAHDEGHGPKLSATEAQPNHAGAAVAPVVAKSDEKKMLHKAEIVRKDGTLQVFIYDKTGKTAANLAEFDKTATATVSWGAKKARKTTEVKLEQKDGAYVGTLPKASTPYNVEVNLKKGTQALLTSFQNLE